MKNTKLGRRNAGRLTAAAVAFAAAFILAVMPAAAATINATDVTIRNTAEDKSDYSNAIGVLNEGDQVTVLSRTTDASGIEWFYIELENGNKGYVKAQWVSNDGAAVPEEESAPAQEAAEQEAAERERQKQEEERLAFLKKRQEELEEKQAVRSGESEGYRQSCATCRQKLHSSVPHSERR